MAAELVGRCRVRFRGQPPLVARRPGHREHHSPRRGTANAWPDAPSLPPPAPTGLSSESLWPAVASRDIHVGRQTPVWRGGHGAPLLATGQADPAARRDLQPVSGRSTGAVTASTVPSTLQGYCLRFSTEQVNVRTLCNLTTTSVWSTPPGMDFSSAALPRFPWLQAFEGVL
jgi:hypothetical protein